MKGLGYVQTFTPILLRERVKKISRSDLEGESTEASFLEKGKLRGLKV